MKGYLRLTVLATILLAIACADLHAQISTRKVAPSISIGIAASQNVIASGTRVELHILVTNVSKGLIHMSRSNGDDQAALSYYTVDLRDTKGDSPPKTMLNRILSGEPVPLPPGKGGIITGSSMIFPLQPGETLKDDMILNDLFDLNTPGKYTIQIQHDDPVSRNPVKSNTITLTIVP